jgi:DNA-binding CsgD family transcriptional regulator
VSQRNHSILGYNRYPTYTLTPRELEVLSLIAAGLSNEEAANVMFVSKETVKSHMRHILDKLMVNTRTAAVSLAWEQGLLTTTLMEETRYRLEESRKKNVSALKPTLAERLRKAMRA